jgi:hypothetical protein
MQAGAMQRGQPSTTQNPLKSPFSSNGMLLALDGRCLDRLALPRALQLCKRSGRRLDILLVNPPKPATWMLGQFLQKLEIDGIDYRLTSGEGNLADELPLYVHRFQYISFVLLDCLDKWEAMLHPTLDALRREGYKVLTLLDRENDVLVSNAERGGQHDDRHT